MTQEQFDTLFHQEVDPEKYEKVQEELELLEQEADAQVALLQGKLDMLKGWIKEAFDIDDVNEWMEKSLDTFKGDKGKEPVFKRTDSMSSTETIATTTTTTTATTATSKPTEEGKPVLRIKLVDEKTKSSANSGGNSPLSPQNPQHRYGTGSKNLSRMMSRPTEPEAKAKVANQTPVNIFWNYIDPFFKPIEENDLRFLEDTTRFTDPAAFTIPPLGKHYTEHWKEQYGYNCTHRVNRRRHGLGCDSNAASSPRTVSLRERLLAMMIEENLTVPETADGGPEQSNCDADSPQDSQMASPPPQEGLHSSTTSSSPNNKIVDYVHVDERIRQELSQSGLCMFVPKVDYQEDDPICAEIRTLQRKLREQVCINHYRKRKLADMIRSKLPAQEFYSLLGEVDKQIEQTFSKRTKVTKKKKRGNTPAPSSPAPGTPVETLNLVETRRRLIEAFSSIVPSQKEFLSASPGGPLFDPSVEEKVVQFASESGHWLPIPEQPLTHVRLAAQAAQPVFPMLNSSSPIVPDH